MSKVDSKSFSFVWKIENYSKLFHETGHTLISPVFTAESMGGSNWSIIFYPRGESATDSDFVACYIKRNGDALFDEELTVNFYLDVIGDDGEVLGSIPTQTKTFKKWECCGSSRLVKIDDIKDKSLNWQEDVLTIRCHMMSHKHIAIEYEAKTIIPFSSFTFLWTVPIRESGETSINFHLYKKEYQMSVRFNTNVTIKIRELLRTSHGSFLVTCHVFLMDITSVPVFVKQDAHLVKAGAVPGNWEFIFMSYQELAEIKNVVDKDQNITLLCEIYTSFNIGLNIIAKCKYATDTPISSLQTDLRELFTSKKHSDVSLRTDNQTFPTHRSLLATRSPVFAAMFNQDMSESLTGIVDVPDIEPNILNIFLKFIYTGTVSEIEYGSSLKLLTIADKYQVSSMKEFCSSYLISKLSSENVCEIICCADMSSLNCLKTSAISFIASHAATVLNSPNWVKWIEGNGKLSTEIFSNIVNNFDLVAKNTIRQ